jgi:hypothetical protein
VRYKHELLIRLEHLYSRIRDSKTSEKDDLCELLEVFEMVIFDVYEELERLNASRCGLLQKATCARESILPQQ